MVEWKDLPVEIQNLMLDEQEKQGIKRDVSVFEKRNGDFSYLKTSQGVDFWWKILINGDFTPYYEMYGENKQLSDLDNFHIDLDVYGELSEVTPSSTQIGGNHYSDMIIQPVDFITANNIGYLEGSVIKYVCRHKKKNGKEDIEKAIHYLQLILEKKYNGKEK